MKNDGFLKSCLIHPVKAGAALGAFVLSVMAAIPTFVEAYNAIRTGSGFGHASEFIDQGKLWQVNFECTKTGEFQEITNQFNVIVGALVCDSGDVLISAKRPQDDVPFYKWIDSGDVFKTASFSIVSQASAGSLYQRTIFLCSWQHGGYIIRREMIGHSCRDLFIRFGRVQFWRPAPCHC